VDLEAQEGRHSYKEVTHRGAKPEMHKEQLTLMLSPLTPTQHMEGMEEAQIVSAMLVGDGHRTGTLTQTATIPILTDAPVCKNSSGVAAFTKGMMANYT